VSPHIAPRAPATAPPVAPPSAKATPGPARSYAIAALRERIARIERRHGEGLADPAHADPHAYPLAHPAHLPFGIPAIDGKLPGGGLARHALHEAASAGPDTEQAAAATLFVAGLLARLNAPSLGPVLWVLQQTDLFAPGLAAVGLPPERVIFAEAGKDVLAVMEEGLRHRGLAAVVGEPMERIGLVASRRLQLAAEQAGTMAVLLRRSRVFDDPAHNEPSAAFTRWRVRAMPSDLALEATARRHWQLDLLRCRGGDPGSWIVEACDATGRLGLAAGTAHGSGQAA